MPPGRRHERRRPGRVGIRGRGLRRHCRGPGKLRGLGVVALPGREARRRQGASPAVTARLSTARTRWFALGAIAVAVGAFLFIAIGGIGENLVYYWGPKDLRAAGAKAVGATIRLGGQVAVGSVKRGDG